MLIAAHLIGKTFIAGVNGDQDTAPAYAHTAYTSNFIQSFLACHPDCRTLTADTNLLQQTGNIFSSLTVQYSNIDFILAHVVTWKIVLFSLMVGYAKHLL